MFRLNYIFCIEILIPGFENNSLEFKYEVLDQIISLNLNKKFQNWKISFQIQITILKIEMSILASIYIFQNWRINSESPKQ
jgi:hypothetical protein